MDGFNVTLASTLLDIDNASKDNHVKANHDRSGRTFRTGIKSLDRDLAASLWHGRKVIGIGSVYGIDKVPHAGQEKNVAIELIATHLMDNHRHHGNTPKTNEKPDTKPCIYLVATTSSSMVSQIYTTILARLNHKARSKPTTKLPSNRPIPGYVNSRDHDASPYDTKAQENHGSIRDLNAKDIESEALAIMESVSVLQYLDLVGLTESLSEVSSSLGKQYPSHDPTPVSPTTTHTNINATNLDTTTKSRNAIIYIEGLSQTISRIAQRLNTSSTTSLPTGLPRTTTTSSTHRYQPRSSSTTSGAKAGAGAGAGSTTTTSTTSLMSKLSQSAALLTQITRQIRILSRPPAIHNHHHHHHSSSTTTTTNKVLTLLELSVTLAPAEPPAPRTSHTPADVSTMLRTAFADPTGRTLRMRCPNLTHHPHGYKMGGGGGSGLSNADRILNRIVRGGLDAIVLVHDGFGRGGGTTTSGTAVAVVEVLMDETCLDDGGGVGSWAVWD